MEGSREGTEVVRRYPQIAQSEAGVFLMTDRRKRISPLGTGSLGGLIALTALLGGSTGRAAQGPLPPSSQQVTGSSPTQAAAVARATGAEAAK